MGISSHHELRCLNINSTASILVVDDNPDNAGLIKIRAKCLGYRVVETVSSYEEAVSSIERQAPDIILMDIHLNHSLDGIEAARRIQARHDIPIIYITGCSDDDFVRRAAETAPTAFLVKPFRDEELKIAIELALHRIRMKRLERDRAGKPMETSIERRLEFEKVIAAISSRFISSPDTDKAIELSLADIAEIGRAHRAYVFVFNENRMLITNTHEWCAKGVIPQKERMVNVPVHLFSRWIEKLERGEHIHIKTSSNLPEGAECEKEFLETEGIKSLLILPLHQHAEFIGFIGFDSTRRMTEWSSDDVAMLRVASEIIGSAFERKMQWKEIEKHRLHLEEMVEDRVKDLRILNEELSKEVAERKRVEKNLRSSEERYRLLAENASDIIWTMDFKLDVTYITTSVERIQGYHPDEVMGKSIRKIMTADSFALVRQILKEIINRRRSLRDAERWSRTLEFKLKCKDGSLIWSEVILSILRDSNEKSVGILGIARDITRRRNVESMLYQSQKMEAIGKLAGGIAHDFNNLLTGIKGFSELALNECKNKKSLLEDLREIHDVCDRAVDLSRQLLLFSRKQSPELSTISINDVIEDMLRLLSRLIGEDIAIRTDLEPDIHMISADEANIEQVITNMVINAGDSMQMGGTILIRTRNARFEEECPPYGEKGDFICLSIGDTGAGMDQDTLQHIFEPFFSTKATEKGTGLGLSVVKEIITQHKGWIDVVSKPDEGTTFNIFLPAVYKQPEKTRRAKHCIANLAGSGERILIVEDEEILRNFATRTLENYGYAVFSAATSSEAMNIFSQEKGDFNLLFCDVVLPDMNGLELIGALTPSNPTLQVILTSGYVGEKSRQQFIAEKGYRFLEKPYSITELLQIIKTSIVAS